MPLDAESPMTVQRGDGSSFIEKGENMTQEEVKKVFDEVVSRDAECPYAGKDSVCKLSDSDKEWYERFHRYVDGIFRKFTAEDWLCAVMTCDVVNVVFWGREYLPACDWSRLDNGDSSILLVHFPDLVGKVDLAAYSVGDWEYLIEQGGAAFCDEKYSCYPEWVKADKETALEHHDVLEANAAAEEKMRN